MNRYITRGGCSDVSSGHDRKSGIKNAVTHVYATQALFSLPLDYQTAEKKTLIELNSSQGLKILFLVWV